MKKNYIPVLLGLVLSSCGVLGDNDKLQLPTSVSETIIKGTQEEEIVADFYYVEGKQLIDHISWSNQQTQTFEYDDSWRISLIRIKMVQEKLQEEYHFEYDDDQVKKVTLMQQNLDEDYLEPADSELIGYILYGYEHGRVNTELRYEAREVEAVPVFSTQFEYDDRGNIIRKTMTDHALGDVQETEVFTYDDGKHPYSGLNLNFTGDSYVNNILTKTSSHGNASYSYDIESNNQGYPEVIRESKDGEDTRILRFSYFTP